MPEEMGQKIESAPEVKADGSERPEGNLTEKATESTPAWMAQLPNDLKTNESLAQYKTLGEAIKGLMETKEAPKEDIQYSEFKTKINSDDDPFGDLQKSYEELFKSRKVSQTDAEKLIESINEINTKAKATMLEKGKEYCEKIVKHNWGADYESKRNLMARGYQALGDTDGSLQKELDNSGASLVPAVWEMLSRVGAMVSEDKGSISKVGSSVRSGCPIDYSKPSK